MKQFTDPVTGDTLTGSERISWLAQGIIRRWSFLGLITLVTAVCWITTNETILLWWNFAASYMALIIEGTVGIAMFSQTRRDAVILREIRQLTRRIEAEESKELAILTQAKRQPKRQIKEKETRANEGNKTGASEGGRLYSSQRKRISKSDDTAGAKAKGKQ